jgi:hypothetical protein
MECVTCVVKYCDACLETCHPKERAVFKVLPLPPSLREIAVRAVLRMVTAESLETLNPKPHTLSPN